MPAFSVGYCVILLPLWGRVVVAQCVHEHAPADHVQVRLEAQPVFDVFPVKADGPPAQAHLIGDLSTGSARPDESNNRALARRKALKEHEP